ncbi:MAG: DUF262 domain-containing protein [Calditrichaeota bacterium]|nr:MAG: DUF262 domain-containing protein [Calditrichota bacterium]
MSEQTIFKELEEEQKKLIYAEGDTGVEEEQILSEETIIEPFDPTQIRVAQLPMTIDLICARIRENELDLYPDFQRKAGIWKEGAQSRLIESMLIRIPLPAFYFDGTDDDHWLVVDGLQRLTAIKRFVIDKTLKLVELEFLTELNGKGFDELTRGFQRRILETQIVVYKIEKGTPENVKFNIFKRINTGGLPLSAQEIRHALYQGKATRLLNELAESKEFKQATDYGIRDTRMADRECVLRFLAFTLVPYTEYKVPDLDRFLNETMVRINKMSDKEIENLRKQFYRTMRAARAIFGNNAFRKYYGEGYYRSPINKALLEAWSVNLNKLSDQQIELLIQRKELLKRKFASLMHDPDFERSVSQGTGDIKKVRIRFGAIERIIKEVLS